MTLRVLLSNDLEQLCAGLAGVMRQVPLAPLTGEIVLVQSQGMRRWLVQQLAHRLGCAGSLVTPFPERFCAELGDGAVGDGARDDAWSAEALGLRLYDLLARPPSDPSFAPVADYLASGDARLRFAFCRRLGRCFEQYQTTRGDWLLAWEADRPARPSPHAAWQAALWRRLVADVQAETGGVHPARRLHDSTRRLLADGAVDGLPERIHAFACGSLPPAVLGLLAALGRQREVLLWTWSPSPQWWGDLRAARDLARADAPLHAEGGNPLLVLLGRQGQQQLRLLADAGGDGQGLRDFGHADAAPTTVLGLLRHDVLHLRDRGTEDAALPLAADDTSLSLHVCHAPVRELEVVRDLLLHALAEDATLTPADCLVLLADPATYSPLARSVLGAPRQDRSLPVRVADGPTADLDAPSEALLALLRTAMGRAGSSELLDLLERPLLRTAAGIAEGALPRLRRLLAAAGVRWGLEPRRRAVRHDLPAFAGHTWREGLDRLLLGLASGDDDRLVGDQLPVAGDTAADDGLILACAAWVAQLTELAQLLDEERSLGEWLTALTPRIATLLGDDETVVALLLRLERLERLAVTTQSREALPAAALLALLTDHLTVVEGGTAAFLWGGVTVAALKPMRCLPFRVIAVVGLDDRRFPRRERPQAFDLAAAEPRIGDRSVRDEDRQLFLETLLAARDRLILTWTGHADGERGEQPPSTCVAEVLDWLDRAVTPAKGRARDQLVVSHPLQPFSPRYANDPRLISYGPVLMAALAGGTAFGAEPLPALPLEAEVDWRDLAQAWSDPCACFLRERLKLASLRGEAEADDCEPLDLNGLEAWTLRDHLVRRRLDGDTAPLHWARAAGLLPQGASGDQVGSCALMEADALVERLGDAAPLPPLAVAVSVGEVTITGVLDRRTTAGIRHWTAGQAGVRHLVEAWIAHLVAQASGEHAATQLIDQKKIHTFAAVDDPVARLADLLDGWRIFRTQAVPLPAKAGRALVEQERALCRSARATADPLSKAYAAYDGGYVGTGDRETWAVARCWGDVDPLREAEFPRWARRLWEPLFDAVEGPL